ncbi:non-specific lipid-transfer protein C, cotyledon-specific isoform-like [Asparagus officinalis]|uniref:non-specific lipid-transfer protein C, cotyledon-specific isoform-like n=1 Tax=Asparagus officinalis TaxID=4686 RepID=UPI00098E6A67|nr:non-specific lipid-transfer protein C, cotyledon-specific isoform-like [Asparagus officinalis]
MRTKATLLLLLISSLLLIEDSNAAANCGVVASKAVACVAFATGKVPKPPSACCIGLQQLAKGAATVADRRGVCQCLKIGVKAFPGVQDKFLSQIPRLCGIKVGFPVSLNTNCNKIN